MFLKKIGAFVVVFLSLSYPAWGVAEVPFGPENAALKASIRYTVVGMYRAEFEQYSGLARVDDQTGDILSVYFEIDTATITSSCSWCDNIVRSKQILSVEEFPRAIFKSKEFFKNGDTYEVTGDLTLHGVTKEITSPFVIERKKDAPGRHEAVVKGEWIIRRKDFDITWNRLLDRGGILVGEHIIVEWEIYVSESTNGGL